MDISDTGQYGTQAMTDTPAPIPLGGYHTTGEGVAEPIGRDVRILRCEAREHGENQGCVCYLIGGVERIAKRYETPFVGTPSYHLLGRPQRVRLSEVEVLPSAPNSGTVTPRCEPPGEWRERDWTHVVRHDREGDTCWLWSGKRKRWLFANRLGANPAEAGEAGWRYLFPVPSPSDLAALVRAAKIGRENAYSEGFDTDEFDAALAKFPEVGG